MRALRALRLPRQVLPAVPALLPAWRASMSTREGKKVKGAGLAPAPAPLSVFMKLPGQNFFEVAARADMSISALLKAGMDELPSLKGTDRGALALHLAKDDGTPEKDALDTRKTLADVGVHAGASLVIQRALSKEEAGECVEWGFMKRSWPCSLRPAHA